MTQSRIKVVSNGTPKGTQLITEGGVELTGIRNVSISQGTDLSTCIVEFYPVSVAINTPPAIVQTPATR